MIKQLFLFLLVLSTASGCKPAYYFHTPNDVSNQAGIIHLKNGTEKKGEITILFENYNLAPEDFVSIKVNGVDEKVYLKNIANYEVDKQYYVPKFVNLNFAGINHFLFLRRLTKEDSRIQLYELFQRDQSYIGDNVFNYFISLPIHSAYETWNILSVHLMPYFDRKMSEVVADCPALSQKISEKQKGYFLSQVEFSNTKRVEVLKRIIDEYNQCK